FQPAMLRLILNLEVTAGSGKCGDERSVNFGMRDFKRDGNRITVNGRPVFLRGRVDSANFPLTGYPPMDKAGWRRILSISKAWGLNHYRFHSWCPPEAAFEVADEMGVYFQVELPNKRDAFDVPNSKEAAVHNIDWLEVESSLTKKSLYEYAKREGDLIFRHFGNHPSFVMFTLGNELGRSPAMFDMLAYFKKNDPRHLQSEGSGNEHWDPSYAEGDDFWVTCKTSKTLPVRGSFFTMDFPNPHIESCPPTTMVDFSKSLAGVPAPVVGHETGQFQVYPDFREIPKYTGVLKARNMEIFRERLKTVGMLDQAHDFVRASGALSAICYREDIEAALRTPGMAGIQLLDIQDFPGQGTALVGMLNVFMESKGIIEPGVWRQFCCETVPLLRMPKYTWTTDETFTGRVQIAHYGAADMPDAQVTATVTDSTGGSVARSAFPAATLKQGGLTALGQYSLPLATVAAPQKVTVTIAIEGTNYRNSYPVWVYPPKVDTTVPKGVMLTDNYMAEATQKHLDAGGKVLLLPKLDRLPHSVDGGFQCDFWSPMFVEAAKKQGGKVPPGTLGIFCDPNSPAIAGFPTEFHSNWQWWQLVKNSRPILYDETPGTYRPLVQVIDNFVTNHKLGLIAETKVGKGGMLICSIDLAGHQDKPETRQLLHSLLQYIASPAFAPKAELDAGLLKKLLPGETQGKP
ncbi:MAG: glycoside hydrolase family 2 TIM barrel-domain containing protein, partial [Verrucomicrobiota bacterium]